jgi:large conductance mechanosensitive channel
MWNEFRDFAVRGNAFDLAIGVIIGIAFGKIVDSIVNDLVMPIIGAATGGIDFSNYFSGLSSTVTAPTLAAAREQGAVLAYGNFITVVVNFLVVAWILFLLVKALGAAKRRSAAAPVPAAPPRTEVLLAEIRDLLARKK